jgi:hypothetical protein
LRSPEGVPAAPVEVYVKEATGDVVTDVIAIPPLPVPMPGTDVSETHSRSPAWRRLLWSEEDVEQQPGAVTVTVWPDHETFAVLMLCRVVPDHGTLEQSVALFIVFTTSCRA